MSNFDLSWDDITVGNANQVEYLKIEPGKAGSRVRVVSAPSLIDVHWPTVDSKKRKVNCAGPNCLLCRAGEQKVSRYNILVLDKTDEEETPTLKVYEAPKSVMTSIKALVQDEDFGDPIGYDIKIKKEGSGKDTRYTVIGGKHSKLSDEERQIVDEAPSLRDICKPATNEYIRNAGFDILHNFADNSEDDEEEDTKKESALPKKSKEEKEEKNSKSSKGSEDDWEDF